MWIIILNVCDSSFEFFILRISNMICMYISTGKFNYKNT